MLVRKSQGLDLQKILFSQKTIEINAQGMSSQFGIQPSTQTPKGMGMIFLDIELLRKLAIHSFNDLADRIVDALQISR